MKLCSAVNSQFSFSLFPRDTFTIGVGKNTLCLFGVILILKCLYRFKVLNRDNSSNSFPLSGYNNTPPAEPGFIQDFRKSASCLCAIYCFNLHRIPLIPGFIDGNA